MLDKNLIFGEAIALTTGAVAVTFNDKVIDLGAPGDSGSGDMYLHGVVTTAAVGTSATAKFQLQTSSKEDFSSDVDDLLNSDTLAVGTLVKDYVIFKHKLPKGVKQYLRIRETPAASNAFSAGAATFLLTDSLPDVGDAS